MILRRRRLVNPTRLNIPAAGGAVALQTTLTRIDGEAGSRSDVVRNARPGCARIPTDRATQNTSRMQQSALLASERGGDVCVPTLNLHGPATRRVRCSARRLYRRVCDCLRGWPECARGKQRNDCYCRITPYRASVNGGAVPGPAPRAPDPALTAEVGLPQGYILVHVRQSALGSR
jgi:hypothetical protein